MKKHTIYLVFLLLLVNSCIQENEDYKYEIKIKNKILHNSINDFIKKHPNKYYSLFMNESLDQTIFRIMTTGKYAIKKPQSYLIIDNNMIFVYFNSNVNDFFQLNDDIETEIKKRGFNIKYNQDSTLYLYTPFVKQINICKNDTSNFVEQTKFIPLAPVDVCD